MTKSETEFGPFFGPPIPVPKDERGRIRWTDFKETPTLRILVIEQEARKFVGQNGILTQKDIKPLASGIQLYYPGQLGGLKKALGLKITKRPDGYWTKTRIEAEAERIYRQLGTFDQRTLQKAGESGISTAIATKYPGKMRKLREKIGLSVPQKKNYWDVDQIEKTAEALITELGDLSRKKLLKAGKLDFDNAAKKHYPGGMTALKAKFALEQYREPKGYWTPERVEIEAKKFLEKYGTLTHKALRKHRFSSLSSAISMIYPGGASGLRLHLGLGQINAEQKIARDQANTDLSNLFDE